MFSRYQQKIIGSKMVVNRKSVLFSLSVFISLTLNAQLDVAHLFSGGRSVTGFGLFLHAGAPVSRADEVSGELGLYSFSPGGSHMTFVPLLICYRHTLNGSGTGLYLEPVAGYSFGGTDIQKMDANGNLVYDAAGDAVNQKISGVTAGMGFGYIIPSPSLPFNIGLRYEHLFIYGDPSQNMISLRLAYSLETARRSK